MSVSAPTGKQRALPTLPRDNVLYVVFHGSISLVDIGENGFKAFVLTILNQQNEDEHKYKFGNWLAEIDIPARTPDDPPARASLLGVDGGDAALDSGKDAVIERPSLPNSSDDKVQAVIDLPRPRRISYFRSGTLPPNSLSGFQVDNKSVLQATPSQLSQIRIFEYSFKNAENISLDFGSGISWKAPTLAFTENLAVAVLHIFDEPDSFLPPDSDHNDREFNESTEFFSTPNLKLTNSQAATFTPDPDIPSGLLPEEIFSLAERQNAIFNLVLDTRVQQFGRATALAINTPPGSGLCTVAQAKIVRSHP